ncbi:hypothetical protein DSO57_1000750 [Entomophthora muscae]|uniref:Uncharacterized protein n=1 Tax=Entomophthora muscae TaxID=34485 RepID=A0ACC2T8U1_9FUNG|nr:hypothetical protein DSO57_1000750 [Entomophthora muscae]
MILFAFLCESITHYTSTFPFHYVPAPLLLVTHTCALDLEFYHPHHLNLPPGCNKGQIPPTIKEISVTPPLPDALPVNDFMLGLANQVVSHTGSWCPWATTVNYLFRIAPIVHMAFQARTASLVGVQPDTSMDVTGSYFNSKNLQLSEFKLLEFSILHCNNPQK